MPLTQVKGVELFYELSDPTSETVVAFSNSLGTTMAMWDGLLRALRRRLCGLLPHLRPLGSVRDCCNSID